MTSETSNEPTNSNQSLVEAAASLDLVLAPAIATPIQESLPQHTTAVGASGIILPVQPSLKANNGTEKSPLTAGVWQQFAVIAPTNFQHKSLADFSFNTGVGCTHGCLFCYVPEVSTKKQAAKLAALGVADPDAEWGHYIFVRMFDAEAFRKSLEKHAAIPVDKLAGDGHRAVMFCTTTDPYQTISHSDPKLRDALNLAHRKMVRRALEMIRDESDLNVRILTRSPLAKADFELFKTLGDRLMFGMSLPTLNDKLARVYEPHAPSVAQRLKTLKAAKDAGLNIYVAVAPTYPECNEADLRATLTAVANLDPLTIFHEPINERANNLERIRNYAAAEGVALNLAAFASDAAWKAYGLEHLMLVEKIARELGVIDHLHLWPDPSLGATAFVKAQKNPSEHTAWLKRWWGRISEWGSKPAVRPTQLAAAAVTARPQTEAPSSSTSPATSKVRLTLRSPTEILKMQFDPTDLYIENGILAKGQTCTILGPGGLGKSRLLLQLAICTILGRPFLGMPVRAKGIKWLILQGENSNRRLQADLKAFKDWVGDDEWTMVDPKLVIHTLEQPEDGELSLASEQVAANLTKIIEVHKPDVIAIDPLVSFAAGSLNNDAGMQRTCRQIGSLARAAGNATTVVILHHTLTGKIGASKATGYDRAGYGRGSKALNLWTRSQINVAAVASDTNDRVLVSCGKNSNGKEFSPLGIRLNAKTMIYEPDPEFDIAHWKQEVVGTPKPKEKLTPAAVAEFVANAPLPKKDLVRAMMDETGCEKSTAYNAINAAEGVTIRRNKDRKFDAMQ